MATDRAKRKQTPGPRSQNAETAPKRRRKEEASSAQSIDAAPQFGRPEFVESRCCVRVRHENANQQDVLRAFKNALDARKDGLFFVLRYSSKEHALVDIKANRAEKSELGESSYMDSKYILTNLSYKETEESISKVFGKYGEIEKVVIQRNKESMSVGRATITFKKKAVVWEEVVMNSKPIHIERIRRPLENRTRFFLSRLNKALSIVEIRKVLADAKCKPKDIRVIYSENKRNKGYGFIEYASEAAADVFVESFESIKALLGPECFYEYSNEKPEAHR